MPWRPQFRFRLATLLIVISALCFWLGVNVDRAYRQKRGVECVEALHGAVFFDYQRPLDEQVGALGLPVFGFDHTASPPGPEWARKWLGEEYFRKAVYVRLWDARLSDDDLKIIAGLSDLEGIEFYRVGVSAADCRPLTRLKRLKKLLMNECAISDATLAPIGQLGNLVHLELTDMDLDNARLPPLSALKSLVFLRLTGTKMTGSGLGDLRRLSKLKMLNLTDIPFCDRGMEAIGTLPAPDTLKLSGTAVTDAGLSYLQKLTSLERLELDRTAITDDGLAHLAELKSLELLSLTDTGIEGRASALGHLHGLKKLKYLLLDVVRGDDTDAALAALRQSLPGCAIHYQQREATDR